MSDLNEYNLNELMATNLNSTNHDIHKNVINHKFSNGHQNNVSNSVTNQTKITLFQMNLIDDSSLTTSILKILFFINFINPYIN